jgi:hypothetical protein
MLKKSLDSFRASRTLLLGLLVNCLFTTNAESCSNCPLKELRGSLNFDKKHDYVKELSDAEIESILTQHELCYQKRLIDLSNW